MSQSGRKFWLFSPETIEYFRAHGCEVKTVSRIDSQGAQVTLHYLVEEDGTARHDEKGQA